MVITKDTLLGAFILVIKNNAPLGLVQEINTETKGFSKLVFTCDGVEVRDGTYDRAILCPEEHDIDIKLTEHLKGHVDIVSLEELNKLRAECGVVIPSAT